VSSGWTGCRGECSKSRGTRLPCTCELLALSRSWNEAPNWPRWPVAMLNKFPRLRITWRELMFRVALCAAGFWGCWTQRVGPFELLMVTGIAWFAFAVHLPQQLRRLGRAAE